MTEVSAFMASNKYVQDFSLKFLCHQNKIMTYSNIVFLL